MDESEIIGEIAAQHALLLELSNEIRSTLASVNALAELVIDMRAEQTGDRQLLVKSFEKRRDKAYLFSKKEAVANLKRATADLEKQLRGK
jgi:hypothetical protein